MTNETDTSSESEWESWPTQADSLRHGGDIVEVSDAQTGDVILRGRVTAWTDLLGSGGILDTDKDGNFKQGISFPQNPREYENKIGEKLRFRVVKKNQNRLDSPEAA